VAEPLRRAWLGRASRRSAPGGVAVPCRDGSRGIRPLFSWYPAVGLPAAAFGGWRVCAGRITAVIGPLAWVSWRWACCGHIPAATGPWLDLASRGGPVERLWGPCPLQALDGLLGPARALKSPGAGDEAVLRHRLARQPSPRPSTRLPPAGAGTSRGRGVGAIPALQTREPKPEEVVVSYSEHDLISLGALVSRVNLVLRKATLER